MRFHLDQVVKDSLIEARWHTTSFVARWLDPDAIEFYERLMAARNGRLNIRILPRHRILYASVAKAGSSRIKWILSQIAGERTRTLKPRRRRRPANPPTWRSVSLSTFFRVATDPATLRFSFVRNPYDRLVSCWADKFQNKPLVASKLFTRGDPEIDIYLAARRQIDDRLPEGPDQTLSFRDFVTYATVVGYRGTSNHLRRQSDLLDLPGIPIDFIGRLESFATDIARVFDHVDAGEELRKQASVRVHASQRTRTADYYTQELADRVYRAYEPDFDRLGYPRAVPN